MHLTSNVRFALVWVVGVAVIFPIARWWFRKEGYTPTNFRMFALCLLFWWVLPAIAPGILMTRVAVYLLGERRP